MFESFLALAIRFLPLLSTLALALFILSIANYLLRKRWQQQAEMQFRFQLIMLSMTCAAILAVVIALPISDTLRGQLLSLMGIIFSAAIALSATTFIGNMLAGFMLRVIKSTRPGEFITLADITGRVTEMGLLHTEIQTEDRDLVTVPNLFMVTQPMKVVRSSGTIISAEVSLGYDIPRDQVSTLLIAAANRVGLSDSFVQIKALDDYSVLYRIAGLLTDVKSLPSSRSSLREAMLDSLHAQGIEIVSPHFINTRSLNLQDQFIPKTNTPTETSPPSKAESVAFDKAEIASLILALSEKIDAIDQQLKSKDEKVRLSDTQIGQLEAKKQALMEQRDRAEKQARETD